MEIAVDVEVAADRALGASVDFAVADESFVLAFVDDDEVPSLTASPNREELLPPAATCPDAKKGTSAVVVAATGVVAWRSCAGKVPQAPPMSDQQRQPSANTPRVMSALQGFYRRCFLFVCRAFAELF